jgi:hypothetical protein
LNWRLLIQIEDMIKLKDQLIKVDIDVLEAHILSILYDNKPLRLKKYLELCKAISNPTEWEALSNEEKKASKIIRNINKLLDNRERSAVFEITLKQLSFTNDFVSYE